MPLNKYSIALSCVFRQWIPRKQMYFSTFCTKVSEKFEIGLPIEILAKMSYYIDTERMSPMY